MNYKELQAQLKTLKNQGLTDIKLNSSKEILQAEYNRLTAVVEVIKVEEINEVTNVKEVTEFNWNTESDKARLVNEQLAKYVPSAKWELLTELQYQVLKIVADSKNITLQTIDSLDSIEVHDAYMDCKSLYPELFPTVSTPENEVKESITDIELNEKYDYKIAYTSRKFGAVKNCFTFYQAFELQSCVTECLEDEQVQRHFYTGYEWLNRTDFKTVKVMGVTPKRNLDSIEYSSGYNLSHATCYN